MKLVVLTIISTLLIGCSCKTKEAKVNPPTVVTEYAFIEPDIPAELLEVVPAPDPAPLKDVKVCKGEKALREYGLKLLNANFTNSQKIKALEKLLK